MQFLVTRTLFRVHHVVRLNVFLFAVFFSPPLVKVFQPRVVLQLGEHGKALKMEVQKFNSTQKIQRNQNQRRGTDTKHTREQQSSPKVLKEARLARTRGRS